MQILQHKLQQKLITADHNLLAGRYTFTSMADKLTQWLTNSIAPKTAAIWMQAKIWRQRARQRRALSQLSGYELKDIGVTRYDAIHEANKPFWKS